MPTKSLFEQEAPKIGAQKCSTKGGVREPVHVEFAMNNRELVKAECSRKECSRLRANDLIKIRSGPGKPNQRKVSS